MKYSFLFIIVFICCPLPSIAERGRIFKGATAPSDSFSYHVRVRVPINPTLNSNCGGSLLNTTWVLTAAHCFDKGNKLLTEVQLSYGEKTVRLLARNVIIHENYIKVTAQVGPINDIALISIPKIPENMLPNGTMQSIELPPQQEQQQQMRKQRQSIGGESVVISGWGRTSQSATGPAAALQFTTLNILSDNECTSRVKRVQVVSQFCAFKSDSSACQGDSGGAAVLQGTNMQLGIMSYVMDPMCRAGYPVICTRISYYLAWIKSQMDRSA